MATLSAGYVFGASETVTNAKLASLVNSGTVTGITQADMTTGIGTIATQGSAPSDTDSLWLDTSFSPYALKFYNGSAWVPVARWGQLRNNTAQSATAGMVVVIDTAANNSFTFASTEGNNFAPSIVLGTIAASAQGFVVDQGEGILCLLEVSASAGSFIRTSTASGKSTPIGSLAAGVFGIVTTPGTASATCKLFGIAGAGASVSDNNIWTGSNTFNSTVGLQGVTTLTTASASTTNWSPIVNIITAASGTSATGTTAFPKDDSIPQNNEGDEFISASITPKNTKHRLNIQVVLYGAVSAGGYVQAALFQDSTANALAAANCNAGSNQVVPLVINYDMEAGTTSSTTFKVRAGGTSGTFTRNGESSGQFYGGVFLSTIRIVEYKLTT